MLEHSQLAFYEQAVRPVPQESRVFVEQAGQPVADGILPVPQESRVFVEQAGQPVADNGATSQLYQTNLALIFPDELTRHLSHIIPPQLSRISTTSLSGRIIIISQPNSSHQLFTRNITDKPQIFVIISRSRFSRFS
jgi:hypothetical protein